MAKATIQAELRKLEGALKLAAIQYGAHITLLSTRALQRAAQDYADKVTQWGAACFKEVTQDG